MSILEVFRSKFPSISMREAQSLLEQDSSIRLIDVRTPKEYAAGHIPRSRNVPLDRISGISSVEPLYVYLFVLPSAAGAANRLAARLSIWGIPT